MGKHKEPPAKKKRELSGKNLIKPVIYSVLLAGLLYITNLFFGYSTTEQIPPFLLFMEDFILTINPFLIWIQALIIFSVGFLIVDSIGDAVYDIFDERSEETASSLKTITRIVGFGLLVAILVSMLNVDPTAAVALASFLGIAIGFAGQHVLGELLAGIMIVINRPIKPGETVTIKGRTGVVKEVSLTRVRIELPGGKSEVLIPSSVIISSNILRERRSDE